MVKYHAAGGHSHYMSLITAAAACCAKLLCIVVVPSPYIIHNRLHPTNATHSVAPNPDALVTQEWVKPSSRNGACACSTCVQRDLHTFACRDCQSFHTRLTTTRDTALTPFISARSAQHSQENGCRDQHSPSNMRHTCTSLTVPS
jgi:hypothetical protein